MPKHILLLLALTAGWVRAAVPPELTAALKTFRTDAPNGWSFTQTSATEDKMLVERFDAAQPDFDRWTLLQKDGRAPDADEQRDYKEKLSRRSRGGTAPKLTDQFDLTAMETVADTLERATYRFRLRPGESDDRTAAFLRVTLVLHKPTRTVESLEFASTGGFSPTFAVKIAEMKTAMVFSLPVGDRPSLLQRVTTRLRGRAFYFKSLDADMTVDFSDYAKIQPKR